MLSENQSEACARCKAEYRKPLEDKIKRLQTENQNLKATAKIAVQAGESLQKELEAVKAENEKLMADVRTCIAEYFRPLDDKGLGILYKLLKGR